MKSCAYCGNPAAFSQSQACLASISNRKKSTDALEWKILLAWAILTDRHYRKARNYSTLIQLAVKINNQRFVFLGTLLIPLHVIYLTPLPSPAPPPPTPCNMSANTHTQCLFISCRLLNGPHHHHYTPISFQQDDDRDKLVKKHSKSHSPPRSPSSQHCNYSSAFHSNSKGIIIIIMNNNEKKKGRKNNAWLPRTDGGEMEFLWIISLANHKLTVGWLEQWRLPWVARGQWRTAAARFQWADGSAT